MSHLDPNANGPKLSRPMVTSYRSKGVQYIPHYVGAEERRAIIAIAKRERVPYFVLPRPRA